MKSYDEKAVNKTLPQKSFLVVLFFLAGITFLRAQTQILVSGTTFDPQAGHTADAFLGVEYIKMYGPLIGQITAGAPKAANLTSFNSKFQYAIVNNPYMLDKTFYGDQSVTPGLDYQMVFSPNDKSGDNFLEYKVSGLVPGSDFTVSIDYCAPTSISATCATDNNERGFRVGANPDSYNMTSGIDVPNFKMGKCGTVKYSTPTNSNTSYFSKVDANGNLSIRLNFKQSAACLAFAIKKIEIFGVLKPDILCAQGVEVCAGEMVRLEPKVSYIGTDFKWEVNAKSTGWKSISTDVATMYELTAGVGDYQFRMSFVPSGSTTAVVSDPIKVTAVQCCDVASGGSGARQIIYYDDFGRVDLTDKTGKTFYVRDYTDITNPKEVKIPATRIGTDGFRYSLATAPIGATFSAASGPFGDGYYAVAAYITTEGAVGGYNGAKLSWMGNPGGMSTRPALALDHSGKSEGAALFINVPFNSSGQTIYTRKFNNLCAGNGKTIYFECYFATANNDQYGCKIKLQLINGDGVTKEVEGAAYKQGEVGGGTWVRLATQIDLGSTNGLTMNIINSAPNTWNEHGNDLVIDDIKLLACSPPAVNLITSALVTNICKDDITSLVKVTNTLKSFYANNPYYLLQWTSTPDDKTSWSDLGTPQSTENFVITNPIENTNYPFYHLTNGEKVYLRVVAGAQASISTVPNIGYFNADDPCRNYSVSDPIEFTIDCPTCANPKAVKITTNDADNYICPSGSLIAKSNDQADIAKFDFSWYLGHFNKGGALKQGPTDNAINSSYTVSYTAPGTYYLLVRDKNMPTETLCWSYDSVVVKAAPKPVYTITGGGTVCQGTTPSDVVVTLTTGTPNWSMTYTNGTAVSKTGISASTYKITSPTDGTYTLTAVADKYCTGDVITTEKATVKTNPSPTAQITANKLTYCGTTSDVTLTVSAVGTVDLTGATYQWKKDGANVGTNSTQLLNATAGKYKVVVSLNTCTYTTEEITVTGYDKPEFTISGAGNYCPEATSRTSVVINFTKGTAPFTFTESVTGAGTSATSTFSIANPKAGTYSITELTDKNGCKADANTASVKVVDFAKPNLTIADLAPFCVGSKTSVDVTLGMVNAAGTLDYSTSKGTISTAGVLSVNGAGDYTITAKLTDATVAKCTNTVTKTLTVWELPTVTISPKNGTVCSGFSFDLSATGTGGSGAGYTYSWTGSGLSNTAIQSPSLSKTVSSKESVAVTVTTKDNNGCVSSADNTTVTVFPVPTATLSAVAEICEGDAAPTVTASITPSGVSGVGTWTGASKLTETTASFTATTSGTISFSFKTSLADGSCSMAAPVTKDIAVNKLPVLSISYPKSAICDYASAITATTSHMGGSFAISPSYSSFSATTGAFTPTTATAATVYTVTYNYTDAKQCVGKPVTTTLTLNPRPKLSFVDAYSQMCDYAKAFTLKTNQTSGVTFSSSSTGLIGNTFDPAVAGKGGPYTLFADYTDPSTQCAALQASHDITVNHTYAPSPLTPASEINSNVKSQATVPNICATGTSIRWYAEKDTNKAVIASTDCYKTPFANDGTGQMKTGSYVSYVTQTINNCQSEPVEVALTITNCPVPAPAIKTFHSCEDMAAVSLTTESANGGSLGWWYQLSEKPATARKGDAKFEGNSWDAHGYTAQGDYTVYVAEYYAANDCYGPASPITLEIHKKPTPAITDPGMICSSKSSVLLSFTPSNAVISGTGIAGATWTPQFDNATTGVTTTTLSITATDTYTAANTVSCKADNTLDVKVTNVLPPTGTGIDADVRWGISNITALPSMKINYSTLSGTGIAIVDSIQQKIGTESNNPLVMYPTIIKALGTYKYNVTQTVNGCTSQPAISKWHIVQCPTPAPVTTPQEVCEGLVLPKLNAAGQNIEWKDSTGKIVATTNDLDAAVINAAYYSKPGTYTFTVSQSLPNEYTANKELCRGPEASVRLLVKPEPKFNILQSKQTPLCYTDNDLEISVKATGSNQIVAVSYSLDNDPLKVSTSGLLGYINPDGTAIGIDKASGYGKHDYTLKATVTDSKACNSEKTAQVTIQYTKPPKMTDYFGITVSPKPVVLEATELAMGASVTWYMADNSKLSKPNPFTTDDDPKVAITNKIYKATQTELGCESEKAPVSVTIIDCPVPAPTAISPSAICNYSDVPQLQASIGSPWLAGTRPNADKPVEFRWYASASLNDKTTLTVADTYTPGIDKSKNSYSYFVSEYNPNVLPVGCEGPRTEVVIKVNRASDIAISSANAICIGEQNPSFAVSNAAGPVYWFEALPAKHSLVGNLESATAYTPTFKNAGQYNVYAVQQHNNCISEPATAQLIINALPDAPQTIDNTVCEKESNTAVQASGTAINWYADELKQNKLASNQPSYISTENVPNTYHYYASQTVVTNNKACESPTMVATYIIKPKPVAPNISINDNEICDYDPNPTLSITNSELGASFAWYDNQTTPVVGTGLTYTFKNGTAGSYIYTATQTVNACTSAKGSFSFDVIAKPQTPFASDKPMCLGGSIPQLRTNGSFDEWHSIADVTNGLITTGSSFKPTEDMITDSVVTFYLVRKDRSCVSSIASVRLHVLPTPTLSIPTNIMACETTPTVELKAAALDPVVANASVSWKMNGQTMKSTTPTSFKPDINTMFVGDNAISAIYTVNRMGINCPSAPQSMTYSIVKQPSMPSIPTTPICIGAYMDSNDSLKLPITLHFSDLNNTNIACSWSSTKLYNAVSTDNDTVIIDGAELSKAGTGLLPIALTATDTRVNNCSTSGSIDVMIAPMPQNKIIGPQKACADRPLYYSIDKQDFDTSSTYSWRTSSKNPYEPMLKKENQIRMYFKRMDYDTVYVKETNKYGCSNEDSLVVLVSVKPRPNFVYDLPGFGTKVVFTNSSSKSFVTEGTNSTEVPLAFRWKFGRENDTIVHQSYAQFLNGDKIKQMYKYGYYDVTLIADMPDYAGCKDSITQTIFVDLKEGVFIPTAFMPDHISPDINAFMIKGFNFESYKIWIYDAWGNLLWYSDKLMGGQPVEAWDGKYKGMPVKSDTYIWKMEVNFMDGTVWEGKTYHGETAKRYGSVLLIR